MQVIAKQLGASFHHDVHREANVIADALVKEGVLHFFFMSSVFLASFSLFILSFG